MQQVNRALQGITSDIDLSYVGSNNWVFPTHGIRVFNREGQGFVLTNQKGTDELFEINEGYTIIAAEEHRGIIYIVSVSENTHEGDHYTEIGCYPYPNKWIDDSDGFSDIYGPIRNYDNHVLNMMITTNFKYTLESKLKLIIDDAFDESATLYMCDGVNVDKAVNVGFTIKGRINGITYGDVDFLGKMNHILYSLKPPVVDSMLVKENGRLRPGNYSIFFKYKTSTYDSTTYFTGPQNIFIGIGETLIESAGLLDKDLEGNQNYINKRIELKLSEWDPSYKYVSVAIVRYFNDDANNLIWEEYSLAQNFKLSPDLIIIIDGDEEETFFSQGELFKAYIQERISVDHVFEENRIWKTNLSKNGYNKIPFEELSKLITVKTKLGGHITEPSFNDIEAGGEYDQMLYQNPNTIYSKTGYFEDEVYPFSAMYLLTDGTFTDSFPITGTDSNVKGLHKFQSVNELCDIYADPNAFNYILAAEFDLTAFYNHLQANPEKYSNVVGFYIMRSDRIENMLYDGKWTRTAKGVTMAKDREHFEGDSDTAEGCGVDTRSQVNYRNSTQRWFGSQDKEINALSIPVFKNRQAVKEENQYSFPIAGWTDNHPRGLLDLLANNPDKWEYYRAVHNPYKPRVEWEGGDFDDKELWNDGEEAYQNQDEIDHQLYFSNEKFAIISPDFAVEKRHSIISGESVHMKIFSNTNPEVTSAHNIGYRTTAGIFQSNKLFDRVNDYKFRPDVPSWHKVRVFPINKGVHSGPARFSSYAEDGYKFKGRGKKGFFDLQGYYMMGVTGSLIGIGARHAKMDFRQYNRSYQTVPYIGVEPDDPTLFSNADQLGDLSKDFMVRLYRKNPNDLDFFSEIEAEFLPQYTKYWAVSDMIPLTSSARKLTVYKGDNFKSKVWLRTAHHVDFDDNVSKETVPIHIWARAGVGLSLKEFNCELLSSTYCDNDYMHGFLEGYVTNNKYNISYRAETVGTDPEGNDLKYSFYPKISGERDAMQWVAESAANEDLHESLIIPAGNLLNRTRIVAVGNDPDELIDDYRKGTRVAWSNRRISESFADGYRVIGATDYQDFSTNFGHIQRIAALFGHLITIRERAITQHFFGENKLASTENQIVSVPSTIYMAVDEPQLAYYGIQQFHAIFKTKDYVYGIDELNKILWRVGIETTTVGKKYPSFSNISEEFSVIAESDKIIKWAGPMTGTPIIGPGCSIGYNTGFKEVYFSFLNSNHENITMVFNERIKAFTGTTPLVGAIYIVKGDRVLLTKPFGFDLPRAKVYLADVDQHVIKFFGQEEECHYSFIINGAKENESAALLEKIFGSLRINCPDFKLNSIDYETERQSGRYTFITDSDLVYNNAEYIENEWNIPIIRDEKEGDDIYDLDSEFRGRWLKVTLNYSGVDSFYIRSILSQFEISFA